MHSIAHPGLLFIAALAGGALNSVAGGGGFICFPALLFTGVPAINANATNTIALWPGTVASTSAYRKEYAGQWRTAMPLVIMSLVGGLAGAVLLLRTPQQTFLRTVPWLLLVATFLLAFGPTIASRLRTAHHEASSSVRIGVVALQLVVSVYIGYFGAGAGILILALLAVMGMENIHAMNGIKTLLASCANGVAVITFIVSHTIYWPQGLLMLVGAAIGGYSGAWYAQRLDQRIVRWFAILTGMAMTSYFFWRYWG